MIQVVTKKTPSNYGSLRTPYRLRAHIESIDDRIVKFDAGPDMRRIGDLPSLPRLLTSTWVPRLSAPEAKKLAISTPQPDYPIEARQSRIKGSGLFRLILAKNGNVDSIQVLKSTGSKILDDAAEKALRQWRFQPGINTPPRVDVPINFAPGRGYSNKQ